MNEMVYLNGDIINLEQARISVTDYGFLYGYGLFETARAYRGKVFRLEAHLERLITSAGLLGIQVDESSLKGAVNDVLRANKLDEARIRITVSAGEGSPLSPDLTSCQSPNILVTAAKYEPYPESVYRNGFSVIISTFQRNSRSLISGIKSTNYLENMLMRREAKTKGADEAVCLNEKGLVAEGSMSNIFLVSGNTIKTPSLECGILPGITRKALIDLTKKAGINITETEIAAGELRQAEEIFLSNSLMEVMPVSKLDFSPVGNGQPGPVTIRLMKEYSELVAREIN